MSHAESVNGFHRAAVAGWLPNVGDVMQPAAHSAYAAGGNGKPKVGVGSFNLSIFDLKSFLSRNNLPLSYLEDFIHDISPNFLRLSLARYGTFSNTDTAEFFNAVHVLRVQGYRSLDPIRGGERG